jgi:gamma-polyglutamate biosynthesis protein CapA
MKSGTIELVAVGDISLGDSAQGVGAGVHSRFEWLREAHATYPFEHVQPMFAGADLVFGNLETVLSHRSLSRWKASSLEMRGHPAAAQRLARAGFTVLNVANNHMMQHGPGAFSDTTEALHREALAVVGVATPDHRAVRPVTLRVNELDVTFLGFAFEKDKYANGPVSYAFGPDCDIIGQVRDARTHSDVVICSLHWGVEFVPHPAADEEALGRAIVDAGADLVLGHHPHVVRRIERYKRGLIAYSLGNFVFDMLWNPALRTGLVLRATLSRQRVDSFAAELAWIGDDYQPRRMPRVQAPAARESFESLQARPEWIVEANGYRRRYEELVARNRYESYRHFLRNAHRRPLTYTAQTLLKTAGRKMASVLSRAG